MDSFVYKSAGLGELLSVIRSTLAGYSTFPAPVDSVFSGASTLTEEEIQILRLVCEAKTRREIAAELYLSEGTVKRRIGEILAKTGYDNILPLAAPPRVWGNRARYLPKSATTSSNLISQAFW